MVTDHLSSGRKENRKKNSWLGYVKYIHHSNNFSTIDFCPIHGMFLKATFSSLSTLQTSGLLLHCRRLVVPRHAVFPFIKSRPHGEMTLRPTAAGNQEMHVSQPTPRQSQFWRRRKCNDILFLRFFCSLLLGDARYFGCEGHQPGENPVSTPRLMVWCSYARNDRTMGFT